MGARRSGAAKVRAGARAAAAAVVLPPEMTIYHAAAIRAQLAEALAGHATSVDLAQVGEIDSAGLQLLVAARRSASAAGRVLVLRNPSRAVRELCATYALTDQLEPAGSGA